ncbi:hypothetical protein [Secundilactobacillus collinoides]|uniref:Phage tail protein n=2 Tax=Secundilactobacillus collinoides TaxID=33960 RepID=A0A0R2B9Q6_SECCO|nr:hypothetical protein [Secundilactobacillus collinoides]KRM73275.1 hypothetical protein FC82_GL001467 [Secundilactobacillus collinoides DSM 20515 = JCM 1123]KZL42375.1 phage tail protein [Secundilactobacillus collinoides]
MSYKVNFKTVETTGLESSPVVDALAGLRANEARYFWNKYQHEYVTEPAGDHPELLDRVNTILQERDMVLPYKPLEVSDFVVDGVRWTYVFYENGLSINVLYTLADGGKWAVGFKLSDGMAIPDVFEGKFKFARQRSKLAGTIRGSFFKIKGDYPD